MDEEDRKKVDKTAEKVWETRRRAAAATAESRIGERVLEMLAVRDSVSFAELLGSFERDAASDDRFDAMVAEETIKKLRSVRDGG